ncbi:alkaline phosphatase D family protein [Jiangella endophytica]|uniref:alkaline phosphatase D family protein n=1 Tax=Jiangella endophytica TaxID=1623398 RepID=UPI0018E52735|nr:alkaline phosphatase D family protein [Jiangella endophytica]
MTPDDPVVPRPTQGELLAARWGRRRFLTVTGAAAALAFGGSLATADTSPQRSRLAYPFTLGIASGDPLPDGVVLWTRLAPEPLATFGGMDGRISVPVRWELAEDESFHRVVRRGNVLARPEFAYSVHVDVRGLRPSTHYFYRFRAGDSISPQGRTKTAPARTAAPASMAFAFVSCQHRVVGHYTAYQHLTAEDLDVVFHLGDYIYEGADQGNLGRGHFPERTLLTLDDYRARYAQYKTDADLQAAHAAFPWIVTMDDHEVLSNWASDYSFYHPQEATDAFLVRRANAFRAYWEHMPLRLGNLPTGPDLPLYRRFDYGGLARFNVLDTRQYRSDQANGDGIKPPSDESRDPNRTLLGGAQEQWLLDGLAGSGATWNVLAQQVFFSQLDLNVADDKEAYEMDAWDGYEAGRDRIVDFLQDRDIANPVVLTGDVHANNACEIKADFDDPDSATVGTEFVGTSISSSGDGRDTDPGRDALASQLPHIPYYNVQRGYVRCELTPQSWRTDFKVVPYVSRPGAPLRTDATFYVESGRPGLQPA